MSSTESAEQAAALIRANRRRRSIRRWVAIGTLPLTLAALLLVGKVLSMYAFAHQSISAYLVGDYAGATTAAEGQSFLNLFEPYKAPYNTGTALAGEERLDEARIALDEALELASGLEVCAVRVNLALVIERQGDAARTAGDGAAAAQLYGEALQVTDETPEECASDEASEQSPDPERDMSDTLDDLENRLQDKLQDDQREQEQPQQDQQQQPDESKLDQLQDKLEQGDQERQQQGGDEGTGGAERPW